MTEAEEGFLSITLEDTSTREPAPVNVDTTNNCHYTRDDWYKLLSQDGYLKVLKQFALSGELQRSNLRSICWKLFLGVIPEDQSQWIEASNLSREKYADLKQKYMIDPHKDVEASLDLNVHNPLSLEEDSPWNQYFQDGEIKQIITQDIVRTHPDQMFFRQQDIQNSMLDILFCYAKEEPDISYRQGMHELLAPILFILHAESRDDVQNDDSLSPALKVVMDPACIDADAFALFSELMEGMQHFFLSASLESDIIRARQQKNSNRHVRKPFESDEVYLPTSSIARKLDKIHDVLLKNADEQLYYRLRDLGIPPQTYGIRWIRLLFGREFHLPSMLQLWDALFVEGNSLGLMDYVFVTMLTLIRDTLLTDDYSTCMQLLMKYPPWFEVSDLVQRALHLRNPARYPDPVPHVREWTQINEDMHTPSPNQLHIQEDRSPPEVVKMSHKLANKTKSVFAQATKQMHIPKKQLSLNTKLSLPKPSGGGGGGGEGKSKSNGSTSAMTPLSASEEQEMIRNPKSRPRATSETERLKEQIEINEAKCLYCGRKMESILDELQLQVEDFELSEEKETPLYLAIAGLKQVRDLLLHKLPFSGELPDYDELTTPPPRDDSEHIPIYLLPHKNGKMEKEEGEEEEQEQVEVVNNDTVVAHDELFDDD